MVDEYFCYRYGLKKNGSETKIQKAIESIGKATNIEFQRLFNRDLDA